MNVSYRGFIGAMVAALLISAAAVATAAAGHDPRHGEECSDPEVELGPLGDEYVCGEILVRPARQPQPTTSGLVPQQVNAPGRPGSPRSPHPCAPQMRRALHPSRARGP